MAFRTSVTILTAVVVVLHLQIDTASGGFISDEERLRTDLLGNYTVSVRPASKTYITINGLITSLNYLDIARQSMSVNMLFETTWNDTRLIWNSTDYGGIETLVIDTESVWTPPIVIENAVANLGVIGGKDRDATPLRVTSNGKVFWSPITEVTTSCEMIIGQYPFDTQVCTVDLIGWTYPLSEMVTSVNYLDDATMYKPNGEFDLRRTHTYVSSVGGPTDDLTYRKVHFQFTWRRRWEFYGQNLLLPIVLNSIMMNMVFALPIDSGEKMGYCLTVLLSYVVFLTWVTENLPPVSTDTSILQIYLAVVLCLGCLAAALTTWVLHLYHTDPDKPMNGFYRKYASCVLVPFYQLTHCHKQSKQEYENDLEHHDEHGGKNDPLTHRPKSAKSKKHAKNKSSNKIFVLWTDAELFDQKVESDDEENDAAVTSYSWKEVAAMMDYFFLWVFGFILVILTTLIMSLLYSKY